MNVGIEYRVFDITGQWSANTFELSILTQVRRPDNILITPEPMQCPGFAGQKMQWQNPVGTPARSLKNGPAVSSNGKIYLGEQINENDNLIYPPEAILTHQPVVGETIEEHSRVCESGWDGTVLIPDFHWKYKTISMGAWGPHLDTVRTGLYEITSAHVYNYVFAAGIGMVDFWHGVLLDTQGNLNGTRYWAVRW